MSDKMELDDLLSKTVAQANDNGVCEESDALSSVPSVERRKTTLGLLCVTGLCGGCAFSVMSPFMPQEAKTKGLSSIHTGFIFSSYSLGFFVVSPIIGNYLTRIGSKRVLVVGVAVVGLFTVLSGLTKRLPSGTSFFVAATVFRMFDAAGGAAVTTAIFAIAADAFPDHMSLAFGLIQSFVSVGQMMSPAIGGVLYEAGGFWLPFFVVGLLTMIYGILLGLFLPPIHDVQRERKINTVTLLHSPTVWVLNICIFNSAIGILFLSPTISLHLKQFGLSTSLIGLLYAIAPTTFGLSAPLWGFISDKQNMHIPLIFLGNILAGIAVLFIGPSPFLTFLPLKISVIATGLFALGMFSSCSLIPTRKCILIGALKMGFEENIDTHGVVSGMFNTVYCLGGFVGPFLSGVLQQELGFRNSTTVFSCLFFFSAVVTGIYFLFDFLRNLSGTRSSKRRLYEILAT